MTEKVLQFPLQKRLDWRPLIIGLEGPPGAGKTASALLLAEGIRRIRGGEIRVLDTEGGRAGKYVDEPIGRYPPVDFRFALFDPPFRADRFMAAITELSAGDPPPACIIVDSISDEHNGEGGRLDWQKDEIRIRLERQNKQPGYDWKEDWEGQLRVGQGAWEPSSTARKALGRKMARSRVPLILTFRAEEKTKLIEKTNKKGRQVAEPTNVGWQPVAASDFVRHCDLLALLPVRSDGVPMWRGANVYEDFVIKLPEYFKALNDGKPLSPAHGEFLGRWSKGEKVAQPEPKPEPDRQPASTGNNGNNGNAELADRRRKLLDTARAKAREGKGMFNLWWHDLTQAEQDIVLTIEGELRQIGEATAA